MEDVGDRSFYIEIRMQALSITTFQGGAEKKMIALADILWTRQRTVLTHVLRKISMLSKA